MSGGIDYLIGESKPAGLQVRIIINEIPPVVMHEAISNVRFIITLHRSLNS